MTINRNFRFMLKGMLFLLFSLNQSLNAQHGVSIEEKAIVIPTYQIGPPEKDPLFYTGRIYQGAKGEVYPYPMYSVLTGVKKDQTYKMVRIENQYTQLLVSPELGGRIFRGLDKTNSYDFFYHQHVIKPALIGSLGAWISGGVEWDIPDHHRSTTYMPVDYSIVENADGSKAVWVGETVLSRRLKWSAGLMLYPDKSYIEATIKVFNPSPFAQPLLYWANTAVHADSGYQVVFPPDVQFGTQHSKVEFTSWPIGSGRYNGANRSNQDQSLWENTINPISIFAWNPQADFLAGYDHKMEAGTAIVGNRNVVTGAKFFAFGNNESGKIWDKMLTDADGPYIELMTGAYSDNQPDYSWIAPGGTKIFKQYFYPIRAIGNIKDANQRAAINVERISPQSVRIGLNTTSKYDDAKLVFSVNDKSIAEETIQISPDKPFVKEFPVAPTVKDVAVKAVLLDKEGNELISYQPQIQPKEDMPDPAKAPLSPQHYTSNQELYLAGLRLEQFRNGVIDPMKYYVEALSRDSMDYLVNNKLGMNAIGNGRFKEAETYLRRALKRLTKDYTVPKDGEAYYYLGLTLQYQHRNDEAVKAFWKATWYNEYKSVAYSHLARLACREGNFNEALELINQSLTFNSSNPASWSTRAFILRKMGDLQQSEKVLERAKSIDILHEWTKAEDNFIRSDKSKTYQWNKWDAENFFNGIHGNVQTVLQVALDYGSVGGYDEALEVLKQFKKSGDKNAGYPLLFYYAGYYQLKKGNPEQAFLEFEQAAHAPYDYCFPYQIEEIDILNSALKANSKDANGYYYLGNLQYYLNQKEEALASWQKAIELTPDFYLPYRNAGFAFYQVHQNVQESIQLYEKALALNDGNPRLITELDVLKEIAGTPPSERLKLFQAHPSTVEKHDEVMMRLVGLYNATGNYDKALKILTTRHFHVWEGGEDEIRNTFENTNLLKGIAAMKKKKYKKALEDFYRVETQPENLEVGGHYGQWTSSRTNYFIAQAFNALNDNKNAKVYLEKASGESDNYWFSEFSFFKAMALQALGRDEKSGNILSRLEKDAIQRIEYSASATDFSSKFGTEVSQTLQQSNNHYLLGLAYYGQNKVTNANSQFKKALELNPAHVWAETMLNLKLK